MIFYLPLAKRIRKLDQMVTMPTLHFDLTSTLSLKKEWGERASFTATLHFLKPISIFQGLPRKSANYFCGDMKDAGERSIFI